MKAAELALQENEPLDYERPFVDKPITHARAIAALEELCRSGDRAACWRAMNVAANSGDEPRMTTLVVDNCTRGDVMSCRALPIFGAERYPSLLGGVGRSEACFEGDSITCDHKALRKECDAGVAWSCVQLARRFQPHEPDAKELETRGQALALEGCLAANDQECTLITTADREAHAEAVATVSCQRGGCSDLGDLYQQQHRDIEARTAHERMCQYHRHRCAELGAAYVKHELPEPVPERGQRLIDFGCSLARTYMKPQEVTSRIPACKLAR